MHPKSFKDKLTSIMATSLDQIDARIIICRQDGIALYDSFNDTSVQSIGALIGGASLAMDSMMNLLNFNSTDTGMRIACENGTEGVLLYPFTINSKVFYLCAIYRDCLNPGRLRQKIYNLKHKISSQESDFGIMDDKQSERSGYLFRDISDAEMDKLFHMKDI